MSYSISIVIPCYPPHIDHLDNTFQNILNQTVLPDEVIVAISETSGELRDELLDRFSKYFNNKIRFDVVSSIRKQNPGTNRNMGVTVAKSEYVMFIDADDDIHPLKIEATQYYLEKFQPNLLLHSLLLNFDRERYLSSNINYTEAIIFDNKQIHKDTFGDPPKRDRNREIKKRKGGHSIGLASDNIYYKCVTHGYATVKREIFDSFGYTSLRNGEDGVFVRDVLWNKGGVVYVTVPLLNYIKSKKKKKDNVCINYIKMLENKKIFIVGGSGSLGNKLIERYISNNTVICYSRDECKHWAMSLKYRSDNLKFIIGNIRDKNRLTTALIRENPDIIIIAAALKHIDRCEYATNECIQTDLVGPQNIVDIVEQFKSCLTNLSAVCLVSTDKACSPVNVYGMCKALSETLIVEKSLYVPDVKFVCVRYGNVLNSRGSIIPILHEKGKDADVKEFTLTHPDMTRFVMSLDQSVDLIEHAILNGESGDIVIPHLISMKIVDLLEIFSEIYNKPIVQTEMRPGEKMLESLINETQSMRIARNGKYTHIKPSYTAIDTNNKPMDYNSTINPINKEELRQLLTDLKLL